MASTDRSTSAPDLLPSLLPVTSAVNGREPCFEMAEINRVLPKPGAGMRRMQFIRVVRGDKIWEFQRDLGPAAKYKGDEILIPGYSRRAHGKYAVVHTVEELLDIADAFRQEKAHQSETQPQDMKKLYEEDAMRRIDARVGRRRFAI